METKTPNEKMEFNGILLCLCVCFYLKQLINVTLGTIISPPVIYLCGHISSDSCYI